ncbi:MAG: hypothetical protein HKN25_10820 [Pyrinomonadaceae bacterium]|nr:hypothetical protein [Pyrinomonadaceae bacterium]
MIIKIKWLVSTSVFITLFVNSGAVCFSQEISSDEIRSMLAQQADFSKQDFSKMDQGKMITKLLPRKDKREVAVLGVIRINKPIEEVEKAFQKTIAQQKRKTALKYAQISDPPTIADMKKLEPERKEIKNLKNCKVGKCDLKLSAAMIERFRSEIDWERKDNQTAVTNLYRKLLLEYVEEYLNKGEAALIKYQNKRKTIDLRIEQRSMTNDLFWIGDFTPEIKTYLEEFPESNQPNIENSIGWSKVKFGLKPVVIVSHTATYRKLNPVQSQILILTRQIYASRYIDASLGLTVLVDIPERNETYLFFTSRTRASALGSRLGGLARKLVEHEAIKKLEVVLGSTKRNANRTPANEKAEAETASEGGSARLFLEKTYMFWIFAFVIIIISVILFSGRKSNHP